MHGIYIIGVEGKVVDNCIECPFHKWRFNGEGICTHIPYQDSIPAQAKTQAYYVCEYYGMVLIWFHSRNEKPSYYPPRIDLLDENRMVKRGSKTTIVNMHLNEFAENTTDFAHFGLLHGTRRRFIVYVYVYVYVVVCINYILLILTM